MRASSDAYLSGHVCHGWFLPRIAVATLNFRLPERSYTITYRIVDEDTIAVAIVEVESQRSVIQHGHMVRLPVALTAAPTTTTD